MALPVPDVFNRVEPWTEEAYLALPEDRGIELVDGSLLVSSSGRLRHQRMSFRLAAALDAAAPAEFEVLEAINVRLESARILIPDIAVVTTPGLDVMVCDAADVALAVEVTSLGNMARDRSLKPQLYAQAGIPHYLRVEMRADGPVAFVYGLEHGGYVEVARVEPGQPLVLIEPFPVTLDLGALAAATRPAG